MKNMSSASGDQAATTPIAYTIRSAVAASGFSRSRIYELIARGDVEARKDGRKTLIMAASLAAYIATLPTFRDRKADRKGGASSEGGS
jgi:hypothetical protein